MAAAGRVSWVSSLVPRVHAPALRVHVSWLQLSVLIGLLGALPLVTRVDPDYWWHWRTGQLIVSGGLPDVDPFSFTASGKVWVTHEWLSEAVIYTLVRVIGYGATALLFGAMVIVSVLVMYRLGRAAGAGTRLLVALSLLAAFVLSSFVTVRPQVVTFLLFSLFVWTLQCHDRGQKAHLWVLPPLMALWSNLHLGFVYGLLVVVLWFVGRAIERWNGFGADIRIPALVVAASVAAATLNPEGPALLLYPVRYYFEGHVDRALVDEWERPSILSPFEWPIFLVAALIVLALLSKTRPRLFLGAVAAMSALLSLLALRNAPFAVLMMLPVVGEAAARRWPGLHQSRDSTTTVPSFLVPTLALLTCLLSIWINLEAGRPVSLRSPSEYQYPAAGVAYLRSTMSGGHALHVFNEYSWGGYLDARLYPDGRVFVDGRADFFGPGILRDYITVMRTDPGWEDLLDRYGVDAVLMPRKAHLSEVLRDHPGWREAFTGSIESVFVRR